ncbi:hypothetical protein [Phormidesmis sp. 146-33]
MPLAPEAVLLEAIKLVNAVEIGENPITCVESGASIVKSPACPEPKERVIIPAPSRMTICRAETTISALFPEPIVCPSKPP